MQSCRGFSPRRAVPFVLLACAIFAGVSIRSAAAQTIFGTLSNFDVFNDTGQECHGFEIELDGVSSTDISYTFGDPYERYGNPTLVDFPGGVYIRYESPYDSVNQVFTQTTPLAPSVISPTDGHACWTGGSANYATSGCEHFGMAVNGNPTNTVYRWLVADPNNAGALQPSGTKVSIPAPIWNVSPPPPGGVAPVVQAVLPAVPREANQQYGDAQWVKVFVTESPDPADLDHLLTDDPAVPQEAAETEVEWVLLQDGPGANNELANEASAGAGNESVTRRYEFYQYTGAYDPENHEAIPINDSTPDPADIGNYIGAQMAAVNLAPVAPPVQVALGITATGNGAGAVTSTPAGIDCGATCSAQFDQNSSVNLTATPSVGSFFGGWGGDCSGTDTTTAVTLSAAANCSATFNLLSESADLQVSVTQSSKPAKAGRRRNYRAHVQNTGPAMATAATLTVTFQNLQPQDLTTIKVPRSCTVASGIVTCPLGNLKAKKKVSRLVSVKPSGVSGATFDVRLSATSTAPSANPANSTTDVTTTMQ